VTLLLWLCTVAAAPLDVLIVHAAVYGGGPGVLAGDAVGISGSKVVALGKSQELAARCQAPCQVIDAGGAFLLPGFHDAHVHLAQGGRETFEAQIAGASVPAIQEKLREFARAHPELRWIRGSSWYAPGFRSAYPTRHDLDAVDAARPIVLRDLSGHNLWVNTAALRAAKITKASKDPVGGTIVREPDGEPAGVLLETATFALRAVIPPSSAEEMQRYILRGQELGLAAGYTTAVGGLMPGSLEQIRHYAELEADGRLVQRAFLWGDLITNDKKFQALVDFAHSRPKTAKVQLVAFKGFVDGVQSTETAALLSPYHDHPDALGLARLTQAQLDGFVQRANKAGFAVALHAIGDRAVRMALDSFAASQKALAHRLKNRVEHATIVDPADIPRFGTLHAVASVQPAQLRFRARSTFLSDRILGEARATKEVFRWKDLSDAGALLLFGTDFPAGGTNVLDPLLGLNLAMQRRFEDGTVQSPDQRLDPELALRAFVANGPLALGMEGSLGKIAVGFEADLILLDRDPRKADGTSLAGLADNHLRLVMVAGKQVR
jgi:predicted amidohydrolase YtcJ